MKIVYLGTSAAGPTVDRAERAMASKMAAAVFSCPKARRSAAELAAQLAAHGGLQWWKAAAQRSSGAGSRKEAMTFDARARERRRSHGVGWNEQRCD